MSYDLKVYTVQKQSYEELLEKFRIILNDNGFVLPLKNSQIIVSNEVEINEEDIPTQICRMLPGIKYLIECNLEPFSDNTSYISEMLKLAKSIAKNGRGVIENNQTGEVILPSGIKRVLEFEKTERFSIIELSWWFNEDITRNHEVLNTLINELVRTLPESLPRRYGLYEPPQEKYSSKEEFVSFLTENTDGGVVWYPTKPVTYVNLSIPDNIGPTRMGYRFGHFSIEIDSAVLSMPGWHTTINRLFKNVSEIINPFYGDIQIIEGCIRSRNGYWCDDKTGSHPIKSWWWNGLPRHSGLGLVVGNPLLQYITFLGDFISLRNGNIVMFMDEDITEIYDYMEIPADLLQPKSQNGYPRIWPFEGPKSY